VTEELETLLDIASQLERAGVAYMLSGSMAMNYYAQPRMTRDIDIVVELAAETAEKLAASLDKDYFVDVETAKEAATARRMFNAIHKQRMIKVDFVVRKEGPFREEEFRRRRQVEVEGKRIWVVSPEDLLLAKLHWAKDSRSEVQLRDARNLIESLADMDKVYLAQWAAELGVQDLLNEVRK